MEPSKDEAPGPDFSPTSKENWASQSSDVDAAEDKSPKQHKIILNEPTIDSSGNAHVKLSDGNLVIYYRYRSPLANQARISVYIAFHGSYVSAQTIYG